MFQVAKDPGWEDEPVLQRQVTVAMVRVHESSTSAGLRWQDWSRACRRQGMRTPTNQFLSNHTHTHPFFFFFLFIPKLHLWSKFWLLILICFRCDSSSAWFLFLICFFAIVIGSWLDTECALCFRRAETLTRCSGSVRRLLASVARGWSWANTWHKATASTTSSPRRWKWSVRVTHSILMQNSVQQYRRIRER